MVENGELLEQETYILNNLNRTTYSSRIFRKLARRKYGLVADKYRKIIWPMLCNIFDTKCITDLHATKIYTMKQEGTEASNDAIDDTIEKDAKRSLFFMESYSKLDEQQLKFKQLELSDIIKTFYKRNSKYTYIQGINDIFSVFMRVLGTELGYVCSDVAIRTYMHEISTGANIVIYIQIVGYIISTVDRKLYSSIGYSKSISFVVKWIITWFSHTQTQDAISSRIFDLLLGSHPTKSFYMCAAIILTNKSKLNGCIDDFIETFQSFDFKNEEEIENIRAEIKNIKAIVTKPMLISYCGKYFEKNSFIIKGQDDWLFQRK